MKVVERVFKHYHKQYEKPESLLPPIWMALLMGILFNKLFEDIYELNPDDYMGLRKWVINRCKTYDFSLPLPKKLHTKMYYGGMDEKGNYRGRRLSNSQLRIFYDTVKTVLEMGLNEKAIIEYLLRSNTISHEMRMHLYQIQDGMQVSAKTFYELMAEKGETFGKYESEVLLSVSMSGSIVEVIPDLLKNLKNLEDLDRTMRTVKVSLVGNLVAAVGLMYLNFAIIMPIMLDIFDKETMPRDVQILDRLGEILKEPWFIALSIVITIGIFVLLKLFKDTQIFGLVSVKMPYIGKVFIFSECFNFVSNLYFQNLYMDSGEYSRLKSSINVISNGFIKSFFMKRYDYLYEMSLGTVDFFKDNRFFDPLVLYKVSLGAKSARLTEKVGDVYEWYGKENKELMKRLPGLVGELSMMVMVVAILVTATASFRVDYLIYQGTGLGF